MKRLALATVLVAAAAVLTATGALATGIASLDGEAAKTLTAIDTIPTKAQIDNAFQKDNQPALQTLAAIVGDSDPSPDAISIRLRAIHALAKYCPATPCSTGDLAHQAVWGVIDTLRTKIDNLMPLTGAEILQLRAAIETLGIMRVSGDIATLTPLLANPSRDIRAATARALRDLCNAQAITPLRARYAIESTDQVKLAISEALRILAQCATNQ